MGARIVQRAFIAVYWSVRAQHVRGTCASWWDVGGMFLFRARLEKCAAWGFFGGNALFSARLSFVYWSVRVRHVRGTCASWWMWGGKFLFLERLEKCAAWGFFGDALFSARLSFISRGVRARHVRGCIVLGVVLMYSERHEEAAVINTEPSACDRRCVYPCGYFFRISVCRRR